MKIAIFCGASLILMVLAGCGTSTPGLGSWPDSSTINEETMIQEIVRSVSCELRAAVTNIIDKDIDDSKRRPSGRRYTDFLNDWGAEVALNLTIIEKSSLSPSAIITSATNILPIFSANSGISLSSEATRMEKMNTFYTIKQLYYPGNPNCEPGDGNRYGSALVQSDLRLYSLLEGRIGVSILGYANEPISGEKNVLNHTISFKIQTSGNLTPSWKLVRATVNPSGNLFSTSRDNTQELVITFGPIDRAKDGKKLIAIAEQAHQNAQLQTGLRTLLLSPLN